MNHSNQSGALYFGDCAAGDRPATAQEIAAWELARQNNPQTRIAEILASAGVTTLAGLQGLAAGMIGGAFAMSVSEEVLYQINPGYKELKDGIAEVISLQGQL